MMLVSELIDALHTAAEKSEMDEEVLVNGKEIISVMLEDGVVHFDNGDDVDSPHLMEESCVNIKSG